MFLPFHLQPRPWSEAVTASPTVRIKARDRHANTLIQCRRTGDYAEALGCVRSALAARYALPIGLDWTGLYDPTTGALRIPADPTRGGRREWLPVLNLSWFEAPASVAAVPEGRTAQEHARALSGQLRALDLLWSTAAWLLGGSVATYVRSSGAVWYSPAEIERVKVGAYALARADYYANEGLWEAHRAYARALCDAYQLHAGKAHKCEARLVAAANTVRRIQHPKAARKAA